MPSATTLPAQSGFADRTASTSACTTAIWTSPSHSPLTDSTLPFDSSGFRRTFWDTVLPLISGTTPAQFSLSRLPHATSTSTMSAFSFAARRSDSESAQTGTATRTRAETIGAKRMRRRMLISCIEFHKGRRETAPTLVIEQVHDKTATGPPLAGASLRRIQAQSAWMPGLSRHSPDRGHFRAETAALSTPRPPPRPARPATAIAPPDWASRRRRLAPAPGPVHDIADHDDAGRDVDTLPGRLESTLSRHVGCGRDEGPGRDVALQE